MNVPRELLEALVSHEDCDFDHHGGCQAHMYLSLEPGEICPQRELRDLLTADEAALRLCVGSNKLAGDLRADATTKCDYCDGVFHNDHLQDAWWTPAHDVVTLPPPNAWDVR